MRGSKNDIPVTMEELGVVLREAVWDDIHVAFETFEQALDTTPFHKGLPDDSCPCPHWGYVFAGQVRVIYKDREEVLRPGDAYYMEPRHEAVYEPGTQTVEFSPNDQFQAVMEVVARNIEASEGE